MSSQLGVGKANDVCQYEEAFFKDRKHVEGTQQLFRKGVRSWTIHCNRRRGPGGR